MLAQPNTSGNRVRLDIWAFVALEMEGGPGNKRPTTVFPAPLLEFRVLGISNDNPQEIGTVGISNTLAPCEPQILKGGLYSGAWAG